MAGMRSKAAANSRRFSRLASRSLSSCSRRWSISDSMCLTRATVADASRSVAD
jgi:hypothetical protein